MADEKKSTNAPGGVQETNGNKKSHSGKTITLIRYLSTKLLRRPSKFGHNGGGRGGSKGCSLAVSPHLLLSIYIQSHYLIISQLVRST